MAIYKLGEIAKVNMCKRILAKETSKCGEIPFYKISTLGKKSDSFITKELFNYLKNKYNYPELGDTLISCSGTIGKIIEFNGENSYFQDSNIVWLSTSKLLKKYIFYWLSKTPFIATQEATIKRLYNSDIKHTYIFVPSLTEQQKIIDIIEPIEKIENNIFMQINKINFFLKNIKTINEKIKLSDILEPIKNNPKNLEQVSAKVLIKNNTLISNLEKKGTYNTNSFFCPEGTFLFCSIRTYLQKYCILPIDADVNGTLFQFKIKNNFTSLLKALKNKDFWEETILLSSGTKMPVISKKDFLNIKIKKTKFEIENLDKLLIIQNKILMKLTKLKENIINLLIK